MNGMMRPPNVYVRRSRRPHWGQLIIATSIKSIAGLQRADQLELKLREADLAIERSCRIVCQDIQHALLGADRASPIQYSVQQCACNSAASKRREDVDDVDVDGFLRRKCASQGDQLGVCDSKWIAVGRLGNEIFVVATFQFGRPPWLLSFAKRRSLSREHVLHSLPYPRSCDGSCTR